MRGVLGSVGERENNSFADRMCAPLPRLLPRTLFWAETSASLQPPRHTMGPLRRPLAEEVNPVSEDTRFPWRVGGRGPGERGFRARIESSGRAGMLMLIAADLDAA